MESLGTIPVKMSIGIEVARVITHASNPKAAWIKKGYLRYEYCTMNIDKLAIGPQRAAITEACS